MDPSGLLTLASNSCFQKALSSSCPIRPSSPANGHQLLQGGSQRGKGRHRWPAVHQNTAAKCSNWRRCILGEEVTIRDGFKACLDGTNPLTQPQCIQHGLRAWTIQGPAFEWRHANPSLLRGPSRKALKNETEILLLKIRGGKKKESHRPW